MSPCDPPVSLWESALKAAKELEGNGAEFALFTGDFGRHKQTHMPDPWGNLTGIVRDLAGSYGETFKRLAPELTLLGSLGNDDSYGEYYLEVTTNESTNPWIKNLGEVFVEDNVMLPSRAEEYSYGGYTEARLPDGIRVLSLNTLVLSARHMPAEPMEEDPFGQFAWLRRRLEAAVAAKEPVWIVGHIPPGTETFSYTPLWHSEYVERYLAIVQDPVLGVNIKAQLFGHIHADEIRTLPDAPEGAGPVILTGALSPIFHSNPTFRLVEYDEDSGLLLNIKVFWVDLANTGLYAESLDWKFAYDFLGAYGEALADPLERSGGGLTNAAFKDLATSLQLSWQEGGQMWKRYADWYKMGYHVNDLMCATRGHEDSLSEATKRRYIGKYFCGLMISTEEEFASCGRHFSLPVEVVAATEVSASSEDASAVDEAVLDDFQKWTLARSKHWRTVAEESEQERVDFCGGAKKVSGSA